MIKEAYLKCYDKKDTILTEGDFQCWMHRFLWEHIEKKKLRGLEVFAEAFFTSKRFRNKRADILIANNRLPECIIELKYDSEKKFDDKRTKRELLKLVEYSQAEKNVLVYGLLLFNPLPRPYIYPIFRKALKRQYRKTMIWQYFSDHPDNDHPYSAGKIDSDTSLFLLCDEDREV